MNKNINPEFEKHLKEIEEICRKDIVPQVLYNAKLVGLKEGYDYEGFTSVDFLQAVKDDIPVSPFNYYVDFGGHITNKFMHILQEVYPDYKIHDAGYYYYPPTGYMSWHTNSNRPCKRLYITYSDGESYFRYLNDGKVTTDYDNNGITIREFDIPELPNKFWHCVASENANRLSFGFRLEPR